jgi:hypothetical protein
MYNDIYRKRGRFVLFQLDARIHAPPTDTRPPTNKSPKGFNSLDARHSKMSGILLVRFQRSTIAKDVAYNPSANIYMLPALFIGLLIKDKELTGF